MKIGARLYLTMLPSIVGFLLVGALMYWGQYEHTAPLVVLIGGAIAVGITLVITWSNARYVARRIERLAGSSSSTAAGAPADELDAIEHVLGRLSNAVEVAESSRADGALSSERRVHDYATMLIAITDAMALRLEDVRLPLHILLENRFGELNENQEEMLGAARAAADAVDADMIQLRHLAELDLGEKSLREDQLKPSELMRAIRPMLAATADGVPASLEVRIDPLLPSVTGDRVRLQDALVTICRASIQGASAGAHVDAAVTKSDEAVVITLGGGGRLPVSVQVAAAIRAVQVHGGRVDHVGNELVVRLPIAKRASSSRSQSGG
ncbi:MAG: hypothetical protein ABI601_12350 [bacterium]